jgi:hypothetical protein
MLTFFNRNKNEMEGQKDIFNISPFNLAFNIA